MVLPYIAAYDVTVNSSIFCYRTQQHMVLPYTAAYGVAVHSSMWCYCTLHYMVLPYTAAYRVTVHTSIWFYRTQQHMVLPYIAAYGVTVHSCIWCCRTQQHMVLPYFNVRCNIPPKITSLKMAIIVSPNMYEASLYVIKLHIFTCTCWLFLIRKNKAQKYLQRYLMVPEHISHEGVPSNPTVNKFSPPPTHQ